MFLVDTSSWIEHFLKPNSKIVDILQDGKVATHEFILGELYLGQFSLSAREKIFSRLSALERLPTSSHENVLKFVQANKLFGKGIGWVDCHLLHASLTSGMFLVTLDKNLAKIANQLF